MATSTKTKPSTPRLSEVARHVVVPKGVVSTGWPAVVAKCREMGIGFRWWQHPVGQIILAKRADGKYAATIGGTGLSIPRQVGKTYLVGAIMFALCLLRPNLTVIWTAHRLRTAEETFGKMQKFAKRAKIAPHILKVVLGSGDEEIAFTNGSRILFGARERGFGRGFDEVDVVVYDEGQILTENALDDMIPAMNQSRQECGALLLFMGTPPKPTDPGEVFTRMRTEALSGEDDDTAWVEFGSDPEFTPSELPAPLSDKDWQQVAKANPSYPEDTPREAILRMRKKLGADSFLREGLGIWDEAGSTDLAIQPTAWSRLKIAEAAVPLDPPGYYALSISPERIAYIAVGIRQEDRIFVDLAEAGRMDDSRRVVDWFIERRKERKIYVAIDSRDPAAALINDLRANKIRVNALSQSDSARACMGFQTDVSAGAISHIGQPAINVAVGVTGKRSIGKSGQWEYDPESSVDELAALRSITNARFGLTLKAPVTEGRRSGRRAVVR